ncbi:nitrilase-related carbon-nitrogen hydrolase [Streptomyces longispororuber]|uniref:nitrilase-related carbon-nitrogen hydrolase n=1 Tax=Streptomyces longispororuber TaxID=68230 RepID=UPI00210D5850|nr:nitrilase-related carbon-nitrogen hydrolase [Streptomyces longispororuber]MCQ4209193.1 carbon-nitrogen hydrolase [Streptomyces longispororuber]
MTTTVACAQLALGVGDVAANLAAAEEAIEAAAGAGARVVVLPELANSGYVFASAAEARALAEPVEGPTVTAWSAAARRHGVTLVAGLAELDADDRVRNSAVLIDPTGTVRAVYRKTHLFGTEKDFFVPGDERPPVVDVEGVGRIGVMVCYDLEFPEWVRLAALAGTELLCAPVNWPLFPRPEGERPAEAVRVQADAAVNRMYVAACDRAGEERGVRWTGGSVIADPDGFPLAGHAPTEGPALLLAACDLEQARDKRLGEHNDVFGDRRPELYGPNA